MRPPALRLDLAAGHLLVDSEAVQLTPICLSMLRYFVEHPNRLITKQELLDQVWPNVVVEEGAVKGYVRKLRQILKDDPKRPHLIETARGLGYRYVGDIEVGYTAEVFPASPIVSEPRLSVAVLAFTNMSGDPGQEYFSDGITEDIITELSRFPVLSVIARQSSFAFKGEKVGVKEIGQKLGVQYVVEGSVRRVDNRVRIAAQLIEAETGNHIWAERYDRVLEDIFAVQDEVTRAIVATIAAQLGKTVSESAARKHPTSIKSYEYYLQGNRHYYRFNPDDNVKAAELFEKAIELDPQFARAYAGLADTCTTDYFLGWQRRQNALQKGLEAAQKALKLDSNDALARIILAWALIGHSRWEEAELELDRVLSLRPGDADVLAQAGLTAKNVGRVEAGIALLEEAIRLNPLFPDSYRRWLGLSYYRAKRYQDAATALRAAPLEGWAYGCLAAALAHLGEREQANEALKMFVAQRRRTLESAGVSADTTADLLGNYKDNFRYDEDWEHLLDGMRMAGLSD